ncbi:hypothetical protein [Pseudomonas amygdali]|uniref:hypothetical protein n=1 Tax=Pseudomonas amygdali TaxID=47877 RepID=UPI0006E5F1D9|nr:hypothetical protein [Pseudomonas amygdali]KPY55639.1 hypothetical protein ALO93_200225 [Pseudomonas amygdali pv. sesami]
MALTKDFLAGLVAAAIGGDIFSETDGGFVSIMAKSAPSIQSDIPAAFEMYSLLEHFLKTLSVQESVMGPDAPTLQLSGGIVVSDDGKKLVAFLPVNAGELSDIAFWLADGLPSREIKKMPGLLALPFSIEQHGDASHLLPEWFAAYYVQSSAEHCVPILALKSVMNDQRFGGDWVAVAIHRMTAFSLPQADAEAAAGSKVKVTK